MDKKNLLPKRSQPAVVSPSLQHAGNMAVALTNLWRNRTYCDVFLQVEGSCAPSGAVGEVANESHGVWAHSFVLAAVSPYFRAWCKKNSNKRTTQVIFINDVTLETLGDLVENIYAAKALLVSVEKAKELLAAATALEVREVRDAACLCLKRALAADNALGIRAIADRHGCTVLFAAATQYIYDHFQRVLMADELLTLDTDSLLALLDTNRLAADNESVFDAVLRWMLHHPRNENLKTLRKRVEDIYSVTFVMSLKQAKELLPKATSLNVAEVRDMACKRLQRELSVDNALGIHATAVMHNCTALAAAATQYIRDHFQLVLDSEELLPLEPESLQALLDAHRHVATKRSLFDAVQRWMQHCMQERWQYMVQLLQPEQLPPAPRPTLGNDEVHITEEPTIAPELRDARTRDVESRDSQPPVLLLVKPTTDRKPCEANPRDVEQQDLEATDTLFNMRTTERQSSSSSSIQAMPLQADSSRRPRASALLVAGGGTGAGRSRDVLACELSSGRWQAAAALPGARSYAGVALLDGRVYVVGGEGDDGRSQSSVFVLDVSRGSWTTGPALVSARDGLAVAALGGRLYAAGGRGDGDVFLRSVEALDPREGVWRPVASMDEDRWGLGLAALDGRLYAAGGCTNTMARYDPAADRWQRAESMTQRRYWHGVVAVEDSLYAVGGEYASTALHSVERYRVGSRWEPAPSMPAARYSAAVTAHDGRVYVAGGLGERYNLLSAAAVFDPATGAWSELPAAMPEPRTGAVAVVVDWWPPAS